MINARQEAFKIISKVFSKHIFSDQLLEKANKKLDKNEEERKLLYLLTRGVIKMKDNLDYIISFYTDKKAYAATDRKIKIILYLAFYQLVYCDYIPEYAAVNESVQLAKKNFGEKIGNFVNAVLRSYLRSKEKVRYPQETADRLALQYSFPQELIEIWLRYWGEKKTEKMCSYFNSNPKLHVRVNTLATKREKLLEYFERRNISCIPNRLSNNFLISDDIPEILKNIAFSEGYYTIQDTSAGLIVELLNPQENEAVLDLFAAPGGKATYIAELMNNTGEVVAVDKYPNKVKKIKKTIERLQLKNVKLITEDAFNYGPVAPAFDKVLLDVPCSGWGVLQKKPELRWQETQDIPQLLKLQEKALRVGATFVKEGGYLVYSTCTLNKEENEKQIEKFLEKNPNFQKISEHKNIPPELLKDGYLQTLPFEHNVDGAFAAKLQKIK